MLRPARSDCNAVATLFPGSAQARTLARIFVRCLIAVLISTVAMCSERAATDGINDAVLEISEDGHLDLIAGEEVTTASSVTIAPYPADLPHPCTSSADCPGAYCQEDLRVCVTCATDSQCPVGRRCAFGACLDAPPCQNSSDCPSGTPICDLDAKICVSCEESQNCLNGTKCLSGVCTSATACKVHSQCPPAESCLLGLCTPRPCTTGLCAGGTRWVGCNDETGGFLLPSTCSDDDVCTQDNCSPGVGCTFAKNADPGLVELPGDEKDNDCDGATDEPLEACDTAKPGAWPEFVMPTLGRCESSAFVTVGQLPLVDMVKSYTVFGGHLPTEGERLLVIANTALPDAPLAEGAPVTDGKKGPCSSAPPTVSKCSTSAETCSLARVTFSVAVPASAQALQLDVSLVSSLSAETKLQFGASVVVETKLWTGDVLGPAKAACWLFGQEPSLPLKYCASSSCDHSAEHLAPLGLASSTGWHRASIPVEPGEVVKLTATLTGSAEDGGDSTVALLMDRLIWLPTAPPIPTISPFPEGMMETAPPGTEDVVDTSADDAVDTSVDDAASTDTSFQEKLCAGLVNCGQKGKCVYSAKTDTCIAVSDADCFASAECKKKGNCGLVGTECLPTTAEHCATSFPCLSECRCSLGKGNACGILADADCLKCSKCSGSGKCKLAAQLDWTKNMCVAGATSDCQQSKDCQSKGYCTYINDKCCSSSNGFFCG